ncbi:hypothetical protein A8E81_35165 [Burkholderia cenocepacia]|nr:hypothetical protein A8E75_13090 [Burkholderia cenocepacia]ONV21735.1 hypothetical protein A8E74_17185 [Burkholderia cenocepacia]ONV22710.1 hypothetical protein A8E77_32215 [Burkholderia cenocepacia]ONV33988.1 hypothetical protein A8E78_11030 [Burkholderia cenocepacia]ONV41146.1 hypothetical protein A8E82_17160 [Burkholderia cenocepacia]
MRSERDVGRNGHGVGDGRRQGEHGQHGRHGMQGFHRGSLEKVCSVSVARRMPRLTRETLTGAAIEEARGSRIAC